jgi:hypothetical protein
MEMREVESEMNVREVEGWSTIYDSSSKEAKKNKLMPLAPFGAGFRTKKGSSNAMSSCSF